MCNNVFLVLIFGRGLYREVYICTVVSECTSSCFGLQGALE